MKLITFLVPCYNSQNEMRRCIDSLLVAGDDAEIIVIDDGSKDDTGVIADEYAEQYPGIIRVIHQENGGHGEGINQGIRHARGKYFRVVDSDDWLDEDALKYTIKKLHWLEDAGGVDMVVTNYVYEHADENIMRRSVRYRNVFPAGKIVGWDQTKPFLLHQLLTLHSCTFSTKIVKKVGPILPKHISYEDNLFVYAQLPYVKKICYINQDLYRYFIGREGQSVSAKTMAKKWNQQMYVSEEIFKMYNIRDIRKKNAQLGRYMYHESLFMFLITTLFTRMNDSAETDKALEDMWERMKEEDAITAMKMRHRSYVLIVSFPGKIGRIITEYVYAAAHKVGQFN